MLNPAALPQALAFGKRKCVLVDDALPAPEQLRELAAKHWAAFTPPQANAFPGPELALPETAAWGLAQAIQALAAEYLGMPTAPQALQSVFARLSVVTRKAHELDPIQRLCHRDRLAAPPGSRVLAAVLYLFHDPALGGTNFFSPTDPERIAERMAIAASASHAELDAHIGPARGYLCTSNAWFTHTATVPARFNRLLAYDGSEFHGSAIEDAALLQANPDRGRLAINVFAVLAVSSH